MVFRVNTILILLIIGLGSVGSFFSHAHAQSPEDLTTYNTSVNGSDIDLGITPENPGAFQTIRLLLDSNVVDLNKERISWFINGVLQKNGYGIREFTATTGGYGSTSEVQAVINLDDGSVVRKSITLAPRDITILWEAVDSYVPPFYPGKKLPGREAAITISVNPYQESGGNLARPEDGVYVWSRNGNPVSESSGYGKNTFTFHHNRIRGNETISVNASNVRGTVGGTAQTTVPISDPKILLYEESTTTGITNPYTRGSIIMSESEKTIVAEPYYFSTLNGALRNLKIKWTMNNQPLTNTGPVLTLKNPGSSGNARVGITIENPIQSLQSGTAFMDILFRK